MYNPISPFNDHYPHFITKNLVTWTRLVYNNFDRIRFFGKLNVLDYERLKKRHDIKQKIVNFVGT